MTTFAGGADRPRATAKCYSRPLNCGGSGGLGGRCLQAVQTTTREWGRATDPIFYVLSEH